MMSYKWCRFGMRRRVLSWREEDEEVVYLACKGENAVSERYQKRNKMTIEKWNHRRM